MTKDVRSPRHRIAYFALSRLPSRAANSIHVMRMSHAFALQGHRLRLYVPAFSKSEYEPNISDVFQYYSVARVFKVVRMPWLPFRGRSTIYSIMAIIHARLSGIDLVYGRDLKTCYMGAVLGMPTVFESHAPIKHDITLFERLIISKNFKRLVVISSALGDIYKGKYPELKGRVSVAHDGADLIEVEPTAENTGNKNLRVGYVGHLYRGRGTALIVELARCCPWAKFEVVGGMDELVNYWRGEVTDMDNITFHGHLPYDAAGQIRQNCDVLLAPFQRNLEVYGGGGDTSDWMSPLKIFEYMAAGKAIICSDIPVLREVLEPGRTALLCDAEDLDQWLLALSKLRDNPGLRRKLGDQARDELKNHYTWSSRAAAVIKGVL